MTGEDLTLPSGSSAYGAVSVRGYGFRLKSTLRNQGTFVLYKEDKEDFETDLRIIFRSVSHLHS